MGARPIKRCAGFTLIEVMVVLAIMAVLAAIAYPSFLSYVIKARRIEGQVALLETMQKQERFFTQHNTYVAFSSDSGDGDAKRFKWWSGGAAPGSAYELRGQACPGLPITRCIELQAIPGTSKVDSTFVDKDCAILTLNSAGEHKASGVSADCWP